jgi:ABC-type oligopeptide transport system substrate-binding subunit
MRGAKSAKWVAIAAVVALGATACGGGSDDGKSDTKAAIDPNGTFTVESGEPQNPLQPANTMESYGSIVIKSLFTGLVDYDSAGKIVMMNAESVDTTDSKTYTVKLKSGWKFTTAPRSPPSPTSRPGTGPRTRPTSRPTASGSRTSRATTTSPRPRASPRPPSSPA